MREPGTASLGGGTLALPVRSVEAQQIRAALLAGAGVMDRICGERSPDLASESLSRPAALP
jgi:hypothetical protein